MGSRIELENDYRPGTLRIVDFSPDAKDWEKVNKM
jgi:hypothetical protein